MKYDQYILPNGLRVIHHRTPSKVAYCGFAIDAGSRDEQPHEYGIAHFIEHLLFKGTVNHKAWYILNRMERVGGDLNAYTNKEETVVYAAFLTEHFVRAVQLLSDIVFSSSFPKNELQKEAEVVIDEIRSYEDNPAELIFDDFENILFERHELGHHILGSVESLKTTDRTRVFDFYSRYYHPSNAVFFVFGDIDFKRALYHLEKATAHLPEIVVEKNRAHPVAIDPVRLSVSKETNQGHVMMGCRAYDAFSEKRTALYLLNNILGGPGMNSRLNVVLRERNGLVYNVESNLISYTDSGVFSIYFGTDLDRIDRCLHLVEKETKILTEKRLTPIQLAAAKKQLIGQIGVASDNNESNALGMAKAFLHYNKCESQESLFKRIDALTADQIFEVANEVLDKAHMSVLIYR